MVIHKLSRKMVVDVGFVEGSFQTHWLNASKVATLQYSNFIKVIKIYQDISTASRVKTIEVMKKKLVWILTFLYRE